MKALTLLLGLSISTQAMAGIGGYFSRTCISESGRTIVVSAGDDMGSSDILRLIIDGTEASYDLTSPDVEVLGDDGVLYLLKNGQEALDFNYNSRTDTATVTVHVDPRVGTYAEKNANKASFDVSLSCKAFYQEP